MRTKTMLISALLGALGSVSVSAQNVYSQNTVGYINVTCPPGWSIISCPLIGSPDNSLNTLLNNTNSQYNGVLLWWYSPVTLFAGNNGVPTVISPDGSGWANGGIGTNLNQSIQPGYGVWFYNPSPSTTMTITFVGTVPTGSQTNVILPGYNLVSSIVPMSGNLYTNGVSLLTNSVPGDEVLVYNNVVQGYTSSNSYGAEPPVITGNGTVWPSTPGDPTIQYTGEGFWYYNGQTGVNLNWIENYSTGQ